MYETYDHSPTASYYGRQDIHWTFSETVALEANLRAGHIKTTGMAPIQAVLGRIVDRYCPGRIHPVALQLESFLVLEAEFLPDSE